MTAALPASAPRSLVEAGPDAVRLGNAGPGRVLLLRLAERIGKLQSFHIPSIDTVAKSDPVTI